ncbi:MAG TPA: siderophore-interacting protein, partial [Polyangiales bacterium]|nr:siderophore-interacting protein [Polyangiales bacterium]
MTMSASRGPNLGLVEGAVAKLLMRASTVVQSELIAERFRLITLGGPELRGAAWEPGQKVQVAFGGWVQRTYTPLSWDPVAGNAQLLAYVPGEGPGSEWARSVRVGDGCVLFGPRSSLDLNLLSAPGLLFGDETSIGLAHALRHSKSGGHGIELLLEVSSAVRVREVLQRLNLEASRVEKREGDAHVPELELAITRAVQQRSIETAVLSGKATTIRQLGKH